MNRIDLVDNKTLQSLEYDGERRVIRVTYRAAAHSLDGAKSQQTLEKALRPFFAQQCEAHVTHGKNRFYWNSAIALGQGNGVRITNLLRKAKIISGLEEHYIDNRLFDSNPPLSDHEPSVSYSAASNGSDGTITTMLNAVATDILAPEDDPIDPFVPDIPPALSGRIPPIERKNVSFAKILDANQRSSKFHQR